ncbi:hypothetical protein SAY86_021172 [Trapa natans]|uniref:Uncharacterized protein n=1 Tax=Trapa natans TaxID=22666 RepID=A0AAN7M7G7_TRANT|nr:hypothetical protein SAY86_021172 [Trapa natans]
MEERPHLESNLIFGIGVTRDQVLCLPKSRLLLEVEEASNCKAGPEEQTEAEDESVRPVVDAGGFAPIGLRLVRFLRHLGPAPRGLLQHLQKHGPVASLHLMCICVNILIFLLVMGKFKMGSLILFSQISRTIATFSFS